MTPGKRLKISAYKDFLQKAFLKRKCFFIYNNFKTNYQFNQQNNESTAIT